MHFALEGTWNFNVLLSILLEKVRGNFLVFLSTLLIEVQGYFQVLQCIFLSFVKVHGKPHVLLCMMLANVYRNFYALLRAQIVKVHGNLRVFICIRLVKVHEITTHFLAAQYSLHYRIGSREVNFNILFSNLVRIDSCLSGVKVSLSSRNIRYLKKTHLFLEHFLTYVLGSTALTWCRRRWFKTTENK